MFECWLCQVMHTQVIWLLVMVSSFAKEVLSSPTPRLPEGFQTPKGHSGFLLPEPSPWLLFSILICPLRQLSSCLLLPTLTLAHPSCC